VARYLSDSTRPTEYVTERLEGRPVAAAIDAATAQRSRAGRRPAKLVSVHRDVDSPFRFYLKRQAKAAAAVGIAFEDRGIAAEAAPSTLIETMRALDASSDVDAVLLEHPLPPPLDFLSAIAGLRAEKDVDGVGIENLGRLVAQRPLHVPAVARAALSIARHYRVPLEGEPVAVVGRSETVGIPLALLLAGKVEGVSATVTVAHSRTKALARALADTRTIFSCAGRPGLLDRSVVPEGAYVIDVGLSSLPDPSAPGGSRAVGDADAASLDGWAGGLTPVPGGVGPVTVAELMDGVVRARDLLAAGVP
jgi:methylenetetrahydrofolate dehydrogenase (NADP+) / methenyltetrahydrofolate cyclohydrolase